MEISPTNTLRSLTSTSTSDQQQQTRWAFLCWKSFFMANTKWMMMLIQGIIFQILHSECYDVRTIVHVSSAWCKLFRIKLNLKYLLILNADFKETQCFLDDHTKNVLRTLVYCNHILLILHQYSFMKPSVVSHCCSASKGKLCYISNIFHNTPISV